MGDKLHNIVRALWVYLVCCHQVLSFDVTKSGQTYIRAGSQTTLTCRWTPRAGIDLLRVNWRQGSTVIASAILPSYTPQYPDTSMRDRVTMGTLTSSSTSTSITLTGLQCPGDIAEYSCEVVTTAIQDTTERASFDVNLFDFLGSSILITSSSSQLQAGQHASLTCTASNIGRPPGTIKWQRDSQDITTGFTQQTSINSDNCTFNGVSILSFTPTSQDDGVMYKCVVDPNSAVIGDSRKEGTYTLNVQYPVPQGPRVTSSTGTFTVEQGTTFTLNCQANGNPSPSYVWTSPDNTNSTGSQLVLTLTNTGAYLYTCFATNSLTTSPLPTRVTVTVQEKITTTTTTTKTSMTPVAVASSTDTLTCTGGEGLHSTGVLVGAVVAAVVITFGVAVALFVLYHRSMVHRFRKNGQSADTVEVDVTEGNNEYAVLERKPDVNEPDHTYAALQGKMTSFNTPPRK